MLFEASASIHPASRAGQAFARTHGQPSAKTRRNPGADRERSADAASGDAVVWAAGTAGAAGVRPPAPVASRRRSRNYPREAGPTAAGSTQTIASDNRYRNPWAGPA